MVELYSSILKNKYEELEETDATKRTYGIGVEGGDVEDEDAEGEDVWGEGVGSARRIRLVRMLFVERQPGGRDRVGTIRPTSNGLKVRGTSMPSCLSPKGQPAENNKWKQPLRIYPTSPG